MSCSADSYRVHAYWYAVGRYDSGDLPASSVHFADYVYQRVCSFNRGEMSFLPTITEMFADWIAAGCGDFDISAHNAPSTERREVRDG